MNSTTVNDVTHCQICFNPFGSDARCPHMLHCGHTFCHSCLQRFISEGSVCPTCKEDIPFVSANNVPINFSVKSLSENGSKTTDCPSVLKDTLEAAALTDSKESLVVQKVTKKKELPYEGHCEEHSSPNHFKCMNCNQYICGTCIYLFHKNCSKVLPVLEALNLMKEEKLKMIKVLKTKLEKESQMLDSKLDHLNRKQEKFYQEIKNAEEEIKNAEEEIKNAEEEIKNAEEEIKNAEEEIKNAEEEIKNAEEEIKNAEEEIKNAEEEIKNAEEGIRNVKAEVKETKSKKEINKKCHEDSTCLEETLEKANCNEDYEKADAKVNFFFDNIPLTILSKEDAMKLILKHLRENTFYVTKTDNEAMKYSKVKVEDDQISFGEWEEAAEGGSSCVDFFDFINSRTAVIDTHKFIEEHKKELHNPRLPKDKIKFSQIEVKEKEVYFNSFKTSNESDFVFKFGSLLKTLGCSSVVPTEAFIKPQISSGGEFVITTEGGSPRAINFLLLTSGLMDHSYQKTLFLSNGSGVFGGCNNGWNYFPSVGEGIQDGGIYERKEPKRGDVQGWNADEPRFFSYFCVRKKDDSCHSSSTFGRVRRGMEVVDQIKWGNVMNESGLIFNLSKSDGF